MSKFIELFASVVEVSPDEIQPDAALQTFSAWDSLGRLAFICAVDEQYGLQLSGEAVRSAKTVKELQALVETDQP